LDEVEGQARQTFELAALMARLEKAAEEQTTEVVRLRVRTLLESESGEVKSEERARRAGIRSRRRLPRGGGRCFSAEAGLSDVE